MSNVNISGDVQKFSRDSGRAFQVALGYGLEDVRFGLRYFLLRLTQAGLTRDEVEQLSELARIAFAEADITEAANKIKNRASASPLAVAIANIVLEAPAQYRKMTMLGAALGAYLAFGFVDPAGDIRNYTAILGAIAGATAVTTLTALQEDKEWQVNVLKSDH